MEAICLTPTEATTSDRNKSYNITAKSTKSKTTTSMVLQVADHYAKTNSQTKPKDTEDVLYLVPFDFFIWWLS